MTIAELIKSVEADVVVSYVIVYEHRYENEICFMRLPEYNVVCKELEQAYRFNTEGEAALCLAEKVTSSPYDHLAGRVMQVFRETRVSLVE